MGLGVSVGMLADLSENDPEGAEWLRESFQSVNALLAANQLPLHLEPETAISEGSRCGCDSYAYSSLHYLRRIYAHVSQDPHWKPEPVGEDESPTDDPAVDQETNLMRSHLLCHSDAEGFYVPVDFEDVIFDDGDTVPGGMLGSSQRLMEELVVLAPYLEIWLDDGELSDSEASRLNEEAEGEKNPFWIEKLVWLSLFEAARLSLKHKVAICFT